MKIAALTISHLPLTSRSRSATRVVDFIALTKPRVMLLAVFTALVGMVIAPMHPDLLHGCAAVLAIAAGAGGAGVLNMWYDADIDALMVRTAMRPIPRRVISRGEALAFGLVLACAAVAVLGAATNFIAAALLAFTILFYVVAYTMWLKRRTPQNIVIGGAAGALPPVIGWAAATGNIGVEPLILFLIIFLWTPPHFWALSLNRATEYRRAGVPMLPVVAGRAATTRRILAYAFFLLPISLLPWALGFAGTIYAAVALASGTIFVVLALRLYASTQTDRRAAHRLFAFSILYLFALFAALLANSSGNRISSTLAPSDPSIPTTTAAGGILQQAEFSPRQRNTKRVRMTAAQRKGETPHRVLASVLLCAVALAGCTEGVPDPKGPTAQTMNLHSQY
jgi:protoheme IX farnesyltransferase